MGFWDSVNTGIFGTGNDLHYQGAHEWLFGGGATKGLNTNLGGYQQAQNTLGGIAGAQAPTVQGMQLSPDQMAQSRQGSYDVANRLGAIAGGQQAGAGELAVNRQVSQANAQQTANARMARGANAAIAYRNAARMQADQGLQGAGLAAQAQMQDQQGANQQLGQIYGQLYGQDAAVAAQNAQLGQQANLANQQAALQNRALQIQALGQQLGWSQQQVELELKRAGIDAADQGMFAGILKGVGTMMASDERLKKDVADGGAAADEMMSRLRPRTYSYLDEKWGKGKRLGIMAQDLARSPLGAATLGAIDDEGHLGVDIGKATSAALASVARLDQRLRAVERDRKAGAGLGLGALAAEAR